MSTSSNTISSPKLIVTIDDTTMLNKIKNAIKMLRGVGRISVVTPQKSDLDLAHYWYSLWHFWKEKAIIRIHKGTVSWSGEIIRLRQEITEQLLRNYLVSRGIHPSSHTAINKKSLQSQRDNREDGGNIQRPVPDAGGGTGLIAPLPSSFRPSSDTMPGYSGFV